MSTVPLATVAQPSLADAVDESLAAALAGVVLLPACSRRKAVEVNPIIPSVKVNRTKAPLGSALEITYSWTLEPAPASWTRTTGPSCTSWTTTT